MKTKSAKIFSLSSLAKILYTCQLVNQQLTPTERERIFTEGKQKITTKTV